MKSFLVILKNKSKDALEMPLLLEHIQHLKNLHNSKNLIACGPFVDDSGAVLIIEAESQSKAENIVQKDPFIKMKYYGGYSITEFYKADETNQWLMNHEQTLDELNGV